MNPTPGEIHATNAFVKALEAFEPESNGGSVFPKAVGDVGGMSLRDWFASMPLNDVEIKCVQLQYEAAHPEGKFTYTLAEARFFHADLMIAQREKQP